MALPRVQLVQQEQQGDGVAAARQRDDSARAGRHESMALDVGEHARGERGHLQFVNSSTGESVNQIAKFTTS